MNRISERISAAIVGVSCPGCKKRVMPTPAVPEPEKAEESSAGGRWSYLWVAPSGDVCPECGFPLSRYARRLKWIRLFLSGIVLLVVAFVLLILGMMSGATEGWIVTVRKVLGAVGIVSGVIGLVGILLGGRREQQT